MSDLETKLDNLLAEDFGIAPAEVTGEFIRDWRDKHEVSYEVETSIGGWVGVNSRIMTREEIRSVEQKADAFLDRFSTRRAIS